MGRLKRSAVATTAAFIVHWGAASAWAQKPGRAVEDEEALLRWGIAAGVIVVIGLSAFLNSKRSHLA